MNETQQNIIDSQVAYSIDQDQSAEDGSLNAYDTAIEQKLTQQEAKEVSEAVFTQLS